MTPTMFLRAAIILVLVLIGIGCGSQTDTPAPAARKPVTSPPPAPEPAIAKAAVPESVPMPEPIPDPIPGLSSVPGKIPEDLPSLHCIGIRWFTTDDQNANAAVKVAYRRQGDPDWRAAMPLFRVETAAMMERKPSEGTNLFAGSIFGLRPDTVYDVRLTLEDPDGGSTERIIQRTTWKEPIAPAPLRTVTVGPPDSGETSLEQAMQDARPGDLIIMKSGTYPGPVTFKKSGTAEHPIVWKAEEARKAIIKVPEGTKGCTFNARRLKYVYFEGLGIRNGWWGLGIHGSQHVVVRNCHIKGVLTGIADDVQSKRLFIADNLLEGLQVYPMPKDKKPKGGTDRRAIELSGMGHAVCYNRIHNFKDGVDTRPTFPIRDIDIYRNDISECYDDGIELDYAEHNCRAYENRITNCLMGISFQPSRGGPNYAVRNVFYNLAHESFKLHLTPVNKGPNPMDGPNRTSGGIIIHNTIVKTGPGLRVWSNEGPVHYFYFRNNILLGVDAKGSIELTPTMRHADMDYNAYLGTRIILLARFNKQKYKDLESFHAGTGLEKNGIFSNDPVPMFDAAFKLPTNKNINEPPSKNNPVLSKNSLLIDKGAVLPGFNDDYTGSAPDMGAYEYGQDIPHYGPRTTDSDSN